jgi:hypothetical protein
LQQISNTKIVFYLQFPDMLLPFLAAVDLYIREAPKGLLLQITPLRIIMYTMKSHYEHIQRNASGNLHHYYQPGLVSSTNVIQYGHAIRYGDVSQSS